MIQRMSYAQYEQMPGLRHSALKRMIDSPKACLWAQQHPGPDKRALSVGKATHAAVLEPVVFERDFVVFRGVRHGKAWEAFVVEHAAQTILTVNEHEEATQLAAAILDNAQAREVLDGNMPEVCVTWVEDDIECKARLDAASPSGIIEIKTTVHPYDKEHGGFYDEVAKFHYHSQLAWYRHGLAKNEGQRRPVRVIAVGKEGPFEVGVYDVPGPILVEGERRWRVLFEQYRACVASGKWPGFADGRRCILELPEWALGGEIVWEDTDRSNAP